MMTMLVALTIFVDAVSGVILYITPLGRFANWTNWTLWGLSKGEWRSIHMIFSLLLVLIIIGHLYFNWRVLVHFFWSKIHHTVNLKKELAVATAIVLAVLIGTLWSIQPFRAVTDFREKAKYSWERGDRSFQKAGYGRGGLMNAKQGRRVGNKTLQTRRQVESTSYSNRAPHTPSSTLKGRDYARLGKMDVLTGTLIQQDKEWRLKVGDSIYDIHLGPIEYRTNKAFILKNGEDAIITGFVYQNHVTVTSIETGGKSVILRDENGRPSWAGRGRRAFRSSL